jgi:DNA-binding transcriptional ArsR family regulator
MNDREAAIRRILACLGDSSRFRLVRSLITSRRYVTELASEVGLSQSCTTRHLQALQREGIVTGARDGKRVMYRLRSESVLVRELVGWAVEHPGLGSAAFPVGAPIGEGSRRPPETRDEEAQLDTGSISSETDSGSDRRPGDLEDYLL